MPREYRFERVYEILEKKIKLRFISRENFSVHNEQVEKNNYLFYKYINLRKKNITVCIFLYEKR